MTNASDNADRGPVDKSESESSEDDIPTGPRSAAVRRSQDGSRRSRDDKQLPIWQEMLLLLGIALVLAIVIKAFFMQAFALLSPNPWIPPVVRRRAISSQANAR